jgi:hypothetical protein
MFAVLVGKYDTYACDGGGIKWVLVQPGEICKRRSSGKANGRFGSHTGARMLFRRNSFQEILSQGCAEMTATMTTVTMRNREVPAKPGFHDVGL